MFKVNNKDTRTTPVASFCVFIVNFEYISHLAPVILLLTVILLHVITEKAYGSFQPFSVMLMILTSTTFRAVIGEDGYISGHDLFHC